jgi:hypothetical protein
MIDETNDAAERRAGVSGADARDVRIAELEGRIRALEQLLIPTSAAVIAGAPTDHPSPVDVVQGNGGSGTAEAVASRRGFLRLAGAAAAGAVGAGMLRPETAAAANGDALILGSEANAATANTQLINNTAGVYGLRIQMTGTGNYADAVRGIANNDANSWAVYANAPAGIGLYGVSTTGYALYTSGNARIGMASHGTPGAPTTGNYADGDLIKDSTGALWCCVASGSPGTWRKIAGPTGAGQFHVISASRIYDSRPGFATQSGPGPFVNGTARDIDLTTLVPAGATAATVSVSVFAIGGDGYFSLYPTGSPTGTINAYWGNVAGHQTVSTTVVGLNSARRFTIRLTSSGASVECAIDVIGYYR